MEKYIEDLQQEINEIVAKTASPDEAFEKISQTFPEVKIEDLKKKFDEEIKRIEKEFAENSDSETVENLSEEDLEAVAGGSFGSWMKKNWPYVAAGVGAVTILAVAGYAGWQSKASASKLEEAYAEGNTKSYYGTLKLAQKGELPIQNSNNSSLA